MRVALLFLLLLAAAPLAAAAPHALGQSYVYLRIYDDAIEGRLELNVEDLNTVLGPLFPTDSTLTVADVAAHGDRVKAYVAERFALWAGDKPYAIEFTDFDLLKTRITTFVQVNFTVRGVHRIPEHLDASYTALFEVDPARRNFLLVEHNWNAGTFNNEGNVSLIFSPSEPRQTLDLTSSSWRKGFLAMVRLGIWHIWAGLDHLLFLLALMLPSVLRRENESWQPVPAFRTALLNVVAIITFFTLAHSITLSLAALDVINLPSRLVESVIAASIAIAALNNLFPILAGRDWVIAFVFGLFHGFGFASVLREIGLDNQHLILSLLGFNVGVEIGQVVIICLLFPVLFLLRQKEFYPRLILRLGSFLLILMALFWLVERVFDLSLLHPAKQFVKMMLS